MKIYAPKYYKNFKCIADKCKHSCCVGWEIDIDQATLNKYLSFSNNYTDKIRSSISCIDSPHFVLTSDNRCPHLNENGLCNIIINCGEDYICDICREHPRFYNFTNKGKEIGVGISCEAACELILNSDNFDEIIEIDFDEAELIKYDFDAIQKRDTVFKILKDNSLSIDGKVEMLYDYFDTCLYEFDFQNILTKLEYLYDEHRNIFSKAKIITWNESIDQELTRILAYYVYRYCSEACDYFEFCTSLSFSVFCAGLISTIANRDNIYDITRIVSEEIEYSQNNVELIKSLFDMNCDGVDYENN